MTDAQKRVAIVMLNNQIAMLACLGLLMPTDKHRDSLVSLGESTQKVIDILAKEGTP